MAKRTPCVTNRFRRSRQALAAFLLLGGSAITGITTPLAAHDHAAPSEPAACASQCVLAEATALTAVEDWIYQDCWEDTHGCYLLCEDERACLAVSREGSPAAAADESPAAEEASSAEASSAEAAPTESGEREAGEDGAGEDGAGEDAGAPVATAPAIGLQLELDNLVAWASRMQSWHSPLLPPATAEPAEPIGILLAADAPLVADSLVADASATESPQFGPAGLVGGAPIVATLPEAYLPYDLSPEDVIAMRMYPIDGPPRSYLPQSSYLGARRTGAYGPLDHVAFAQRWRQVTEPAVTIATAPAEVAVEVAEAAPQDATAVAAAAAQQEADVRWVALIASVAEMLHPDNQWRHRLAPQQLAQDVARWVDGGGQVVDAVVADLALRMDAPQSPSEVDAVGPQSDLAVPATLVAQAELQAPRRAAGDAMGPVLISSSGRVPQVELACQTAIEVVRAQAARAEAAEQVAVTPPAAAAGQSGVASDVAGDALARAAAVATVCDQAASSLERLAMVLRRAGDTLVRQAQADAGGERLMR